MRWFIVFLLIANILLFFWVQQEALRPSSHTDIPPPEIGELRLLNEPPTPEVTALQGPVTAADDVAAVTTEPQGEAATPDTRAEAAVADTQVEAAVPETPAEAAATDTLVDPVEISVLVAEHEAELTLARLALAVSASKGEGRFPASLKDLAKMLLKPRFGRRRCSGIWPPSKPLMATPERDF